MNTRGLTEIVILTVGKSLGVISPALFTMLVLMALTTTLMAAPLLSLLYPAGGAGLDLPEPAEHGGDRAPHLVVAWLTGSPEDTAVFELAGAAAAQRGCTVELVNAGGDVQLRDALAASSVLVVSAHVLATSLERSELSESVLATSAATVIAVRPPSEEREGSIPADLWLTGSTPPGEGPL